MDVLAIAVTVLVVLRRSMSKWGTACNSHGNERIKCMLEVLLMVSMNVSVE